VRETESGTLRRHTLFDADEHADGAGCRTSNSCMALPRTQPGTMRAGSAFIAQPDADEVTRRSPRWIGPFLDAHPGRNDSDDAHGHCGGQVGVYGFFGEQHARLGGVHAGDERGVRFARLFDHAVGTRRDHEHVARRIRLARSFRVDGFSHVRAAVLRAAIEKPLPVRSMRALLVLATARTARSPELPV